MSQYHTLNQIEKKKESLTSYRDKLKNNIDVSEHVSRFFNNYFDLAFQMLEYVQEYMRSNIANPGYRRFLNCFEDLHKLHNNLKTVENYIELEDNIKENYFNEYCRYLDDLLFVVDSLLSGYNSYYGSQFSPYTSGSEKVTSIITEIINKSLENNCICNFLDISSSINVDVTQCIRNNNNENLKYYVHRTTLNDYYSLKDIVYRFIAGVSDKCKISNNVFDVTYCRPKYQVYVENGASTSEKEYLKNLIKYTKTDGIMIFEINRSRLTKDICSLIAKYMYNINIITIDNNSPYLNILIVGNKRKEKYPDQNIYNRLRKLYNIKESIYDNEKVLGALKDLFRPEFLNRVDETIFFKALTLQQLSAIVDIQMNNLRNLLKEHNISFEITSDAKEFLATRGFNPVYGARPLKRVIRQLVENPLSKEFLSQKFIDGDCIKIDVVDDELKFVKNDK